MLFINTVYVTVSSEKASTFTRFTKAH